MNKSILVNFAAFCVACSAASGSSSRGGASPHPSASGSAALPAQPAGVEPVDSERSNVELGRVLWASESSGVSIWATRRGIAVWHVDTGDVVSIRSHEAPLRCLSPDPAASFGIAVDGSGAASAWNLHSGELVAMQGRDTPQGNEATTPTPQALPTEDVDMGSYAGHHCPVKWSFDGRVALAGPGYWERGASQFTPLDKRAAISSRQPISPAADYIGLVDTSSRLWLWNLSKRRWLTPISVETEHGTWWDWAADGRAVWVSQSNVGVGVWQVPEMRRVFTARDLELPQLSAGARYIWGRQASKDGHRTDARGIIRDVRSGTTVARLKASQPGTSAWHPTEPVLANFAEDGLEVWDDGNRISLFHPPSSQPWEEPRVRYPMWSPDGQWLAVMNRAWRRVGWVPSPWQDADDQHQLVGWAPNSRWLWTYAVEPNQRSGEDATLRLLDIETGNVISEARTSGEPSGFSRSGLILVRVAGSSAHVQLVVPGVVGRFWLSAATSEDGLDVVVYSSEGFYQGKRDAVRAAVQSFPESLSPDVQLKAEPRLLHSLVIQARDALERMGATSEQRSSGK